MTEKTSEKGSDEQQLTELRALLLGKDYALITDVIRRQSRDLVKDVLAEALHDRQKQDQAIDKVLQPIVERSVEQSVSVHSDKLIGYLYPLVGSLVRKSVKSYLTDLIEKTNQLLENSLTIKGLKWRIQANQAGVSFAQYVASQTFVYRVDHLLLIHRETGILLKSIDHNALVGSNADLISSMLTAINDFVADSLVHNHENEEQLQTIKTDNYTLLIKSGPYAIIVVAVTGNAPHQLSEQVQQTLENIHRLYDEELRVFNGDTSGFEDADSQLRECLLSQEKNTETTIKKKPWLAWLLLTFIFIGGVYWGFLGWQSQQLKNQVLRLNDVPGYIVKQLNVGLDLTIHLELIRDPNTESVAHWLANNKISFKNLALTEHYFMSAEPELIQQKIIKIIQKYPMLNHQKSENKIQLEGKLSRENKKQFFSELAGLGVEVKHYVDVSKLKYDVINIKQTSTLEQKKQLFLLQVAEINNHQLDFNVGEQQLVAEMQQQLKILVQKYQQLEVLATSLNYRLSLIVIGTSDNSGSQYTNQKLSLARALNVKKELVTLGLVKQDIYPTGIGEMNLAQSVSLKTRKVIFNIVYVNIANKDENKRGFTVK